MENFFFAISSACHSLSKEYGMFLSCFRSSKGIQRVLKLVIPLLEGWIFFSGTSHFDKPLDNLKNWKEAFNFISVFQGLEYFYKQGLAENLKFGRELFKQNGIRGLAQISHTSYSQFFTLLGKGMSAHNVAIKWGAWEKLSKTVSYMGTITSWASEERIFKFFQKGFQVAGISIPVIIKIYRASEMNKKKWILVFLTLGKIALKTPAIFKGVVQMSQKIKKWHKGTSAQPIDDQNQNQNSENIPRWRELPYLILSISVGILGYYKQTRFA